MNPCFCGNSTNTFHYFPYKYFCIVDLMLHNRPDKPRVADIDYIAIIRCVSSQSSIYQRL